MNHDGEALVALIPIDPTLARIALENEN